MNKFEADHTSWPDIANQIGPPRPPVHDSRPPAMFLPAFPVVATRAAATEIRREYSAAPPKAKLSAQPVVHDDDDDPAPACGTQIHWPAGFCPSRSAGIHIMPTQLQPPMIDGRRARHAPRRSFFGDRLRVE